MDRITAMKVFVEVVTHKSQTAAADRLDMSRAMVTRYLAELETWLGARLMHRSTRRFSLTPAGEACLQHCQQVLQQVEELEADARKDETEPSGLVRITTAMSFGQKHLAAAVAAYLQRYPHVKIDLLLVDRRVNLVEERIDLAIRITNDLDPSLIARKLGVCESVICAAPAYLQQHGTPAQLEELSGHNCLTHSFVGKSEWRFLHQQDMRSVQVSGNLSANEAAVLMEAALQGLGIAMQPLYLVAPHLKNGTLVQLLPDYKPHEMGIYGVYTSRQFMPAAMRTLLDFLAAYFDEHLEQTVLLAS